MRQSICGLLLLGTLTVAASFNVRAQQSATPETQTEEQKQAKEADEKRAFALLDQTANEAQFLKLSENRIRAQVAVADLLWSKNPERARSLFSLAAEGVAELVRNGENAETQRRGGNAGRSSAQLRQELVLAVARHDAQLAYQFLAATRALTPPASATPDPRSSRRSALDEDMLEERLLAQVAALDPKVALQNAEQMLDKGELSRSLAEVLRQLQQKDKEASAKLEEKIVKKLQSANMLTSQDAGALALSLLQYGPRTTEVTSDTQAGSQPLLTQSVYQDLMNSLVDAALKATAQPATQRRTNNPRGRGGNAGGANAPTTQNAPTDAQLEQANARRLLGGLRSLMPQMDQYLPGRAAAVRQKMTELGLGENRRSTLNQVSNLQQATSESLISAASSAPPMAQPRIYRQAAMRALDEGNPDRARQIANDYLDANNRESVLKTVEFRQLADKTEASRIEDVRNALSQLPSDTERVNLLLRLSDTVKAKNPELAGTLLEQAREYTTRRATGYPQFEQQLQVSAGFGALGSAQAFDVLEPGIAQLNELMSAAAVLSGFEMNLFRDGEMPLQGGGGLTDMVRRYGRQIGTLAKNDFERAQNLANRFQFGEARLIARLAMARALLGVETLPQGGNNFRNRGRNF